MASKGRTQFEIGFTTSTGYDRDVNEDNYCAEYTKPDRDDDSALLAVADGFGGFSLGEIASKVSVNHMEKFFNLGEFEQMYENADVLDPPKVIQELYTRINHVILSMGEKEKRQVGCNLISGFFRGNSAFIANVGTCRAYLIREGTVQRLSEEPETSPDEIRTFKSLSDTGDNSKRITDSALGLNLAVKTRVRAIKAQDDDVFVFCSDGLYREIDDMEMVNALLESSTIQDFCDLLTQKADTAGSSDNATVVAMRVSCDVRKAPGRRYESEDGRPAGRSIFVNPFFYLTLLFLAMFMGGAFFAYKYYTLLNEGDRVPVVRKAGTSNKVPSVDSRIFNSFTLETDIPLKSLQINGRKLEMEGEVETFEFEQATNSIRIMPKLEKKGNNQLYAIVISGENRNLTVAQAKTNEATIENGKVTVFLTPGSQVDFMSAGKAQGKKFMLKIDRLGSPFLIKMTSEENVLAHIISDK